MQAYESV